MHRAAAKPARHPPKDHGTETLEIADNGRGIPAVDLPGVALRHHTSKLRAFDDLQQLALWFPR